jgi:hypothetical protein
MGQANSKRVILTHASNNQGNLVQASGRRGLSRPSKESNRSNSLNSRTVVQ